jgi:pyruvate/2-oxoglutarate dehydrogenase complex dihydrolipoamide acyltransferase (E2) component
MEKISPPVRIFAILIVLLGVAGMLAMKTMSPSVDESVPLPQPAAKTAAPAKTPAATKAAKAAAQPAKAAASAPKAAAKPKPKPAVNPVVPPTGFPVAVDKALREHAVVVVSLVVPGARVDELAAAEAEAGAKLGGAGFLALNVLNEGVARTLLSKLDVVEDPSVLVLKRSGEVAVELAGFVDRETVAQAAANASP